jgi:N-dimethylarginine dimethylaminohydrolase
MSQPRILMCPPKYYGIEYEINPWMSQLRQADHEIATQQWNQLVAILEAAGATISMLEPVEGLPDLVFTANAAVVYHNRIVLSNFRHVQRRDEAPVNAAWFESHGFKVEYLPPTVYHEGAGDALFCGDTLFAGYRIRSDASAQQIVAERIGHRVIPVALIDEYYYHLDTCFCPLSQTEAIYFPAAFDDYGNKVLQEHVPHLYPVAQPEAERFACNAVVVGRSVVTNSGCPELHRLLREKDYTPIATPLDEFVKAGGSAKCLTLRLDGEEATSWKHASPPPSAERE